MATQQTKDGLGYIIQAISNIVEPKMETLKYDKTYRAKIVEEIEAGIYNVQINNVIYKLSYDGTLNVGDIVRVRAPLNNFSDIYIEPLPGSGGGSGETTNYNDLTNKPAINSTYSTSQTTNANEILRGTIALHKISKTGNYNDLLNKPSLNFIPISQKGAANGVASLGADKIIPKSELPTDVVYDSNYKHITVENVLTSTSTTNALSANQGKVLNDKISAIKVPGVIDNLNSTSTTDALSANQGKSLNDKINSLNIPSVVNNLTSTSTTNALSANQGKILNDKINALNIPSVVDNLTSTSATDALSANQGKVLAGRISDNDTMITNLQEDIILAEDNIAKIKKDYIPLTQKGYANGVATLDANMKLVISQLPIATKTSLGAVKIGDNLTITSDGVLSATGGGTSGNEVEISSSQPTEDTVEIWVDLSENGDDASIDITNQVLEKVYPVGSIYISANRISPQDFLGGTWEPFAYGKTLVGVDDSDSNPDMDFAEPLNTGGSKEHTLTASELPIGIDGQRNSDTGTDWQKQGVMGKTATPFSIMQPYITVYMWRRTS